MSQIAKLVGVALVLLVAGINIYVSIETEKASRMRIEGTITKAGQCAYRNCRAVVSSGPNEWSALFRGPVVEGQTVYGKCYENTTICTWELHQ